jgi:hypothetical protein
VTCVAVPSEEGNGLFSERSVLLGIRVQDEVQEASSYQCNVPSSEPFKNSVIDVIIYVLSIFIRGLTQSHSKVILKLR